MEMWNPDEAMGLFPYMKRLTFLRGVRVYLPFPVMSQVVYADSELSSGLTQ